MIPDHHLFYHTPVLAGERPPAYDYDKLLAEFDRHGVMYEMFDHRPVFSVEQSRDLKTSITGLNVKNLFVRDKKRKPFLMTVLSERQLDLKALRYGLGDYGIGVSGNLSFANETMLWDCLGVRPGSVNPFCIVNDTEQVVTPIVDIALFSQSHFNAHPLRNDKSVAILGNDLKRLYKAWGRTPVLIDFDNFENSEK